MLQHGACNNSLNDEFKLKTYFCVQKIVNIGFESLNFQMLQLSWNLTKSVRVTL